MLELQRIKRTDPRILANMQNHYSQPKGFVGRNLCYAVVFNGMYYGAIVGGSATLHLPNRHEYFGTTKQQLNNIVNNIFYHVEPIDGKYPKRNFTQFVLNSFVERVCKDWQEKYGDVVLGIETLVEKPRTGELYLRSGFEIVGETTGYTCKRTSGNGTDGWTGKRIWDTINLRPKIVLCKKIG